MSEVNLKTYIKQIKNDLDTREKKVRVSKDFYRVLNDILMAFFYRHIEMGRKLMTGSGKVTISMDTLIAAIKPIVDEPLLGDLLVKIDEAIETYKAAKENVLPETDNKKSRMRHDLAGLKISVGRIETAMRTYLIGKKSKNKKVADGEKKKKGSSSIHIAAEAPFVAAAVIEGICEKILQVVLDDIGDDNKTIQPVYCVRATEKIMGLSIIFNDFLFYYMPFDLGSIPPRRKKGGAKKDAPIVVGPDMEFFQTAPVNRVVRAYIKRHAPKTKKALGSEEGTGYLIRFVERYLIDIARRAYVLTTQRKQSMIKSRDVKSVLYPLVDYPPMTENEDGKEKPNWDAEIEKIKEKFINDADITSLSGQEAEKVKNDVLRLVNVPPGPQVKRMCRAAGATSVESDMVMTFSVIFHNIVEKIVRYAAVFNEANGRATFKQRAFEAAIKELGIVFIDGLPPTKKNRKKIDEGEVAEEEGDENPEEEN